MWEVGFRSDWTTGIDLLTLEIPGFAGSFYIVNRQEKELEIDRFAIVLADYRKGSKSHNEKRFPDDYAHVIYLPMKFAQQVRTAASAIGTWNDVINSFRQP